MIKGLRELADYWDSDTEEAREIHAAIAEIERLRAENERLRKVDRKYGDMTNIALWCARRLREPHKPYAYGFIEDNLGEEVERV